MRYVLLVIFTLLSMGSARLMAGPAANTTSVARTTATYTVALPLLLSPAPPPPPTGEESGALFLNQVSRTNSAQIQVDAAGGIHVAYAAFNRTADGSQPAFYAYCGARCTEPASWATASLSDRVQEVQLALDPGGRPRMLVRMTDASLNAFYQYAACDAQCGSAANWQIVTVTPTRNLDMFLWEYSQHTFALDPLGRPRFIYYDELNAPHNGTFYRFCDAGCTSAASWGEIKLSDSPLTDGSLAFTAAGQPRLAAISYEGPVSMLTYFACDLSCESPANWRSQELYERGGGQAGFVLRLDPADRPRLAFFQGDTDDGQGQRLFYLWCDMSCASGGAWERTSVGLAPQQGHEPDLALDRQGRPRIAYRQDQPQGLGYGWCSSACESADALWQHRLAEPSDALDTAWPIAPPEGCTAAFWFGGYRPALALDAAGNPRIAYDAEHAHGGGRCTQAQIDFKAVRVLMLQP
jgi:hypothetical protein